MAPIAFDSAASADAIAGVRRAVGGEGACGRDILRRVGDNVVELGCRVGEVAREARDRGEQLQHLADARLRGAHGDRRLARLAVEDRLVGILGARVRERQQLVGLREVARDGLDGGLGVGGGECGEGCLARRVVRRVRV